MLTKEKTDYLANLIAEMRTLGAPETEWIDATDAERSRTWAEIASKLECQTRATWIEDWIQKHMSHPASALRLMFAERLAYLRAEDARRKEIEKLQQERARVAAETEADRPKFFEIFTERSGRFPRNPELIPAETVADHGGKITWSKPGYVLIERRPEHTVHADRGNDEMSMNGGYRISLVRVGAEIPEGTVRFRRLIRGPGVYTCQYLCRARSKKDEARYQAQVRADQILLDLRADGDLLRTDRAQLTEELAQLQKMLAKGEK